MDITTIIIAVFASTGFWAFVQKLYDDHKKKKTPQERILLALCRDRLLHLSKAYIAKGFIPDDEYETFIEMGESYILLGNSGVKRKYLMAKELPVKG